MTQGTYGQGEQTLSKAANLVSEAKADFDTLASSLSGKIQGAEGAWKGAGGRAFFQLHQAWTEKQSKIVSALNEFEASLTQTEKDNLSTDESQSQSHNSLSARLGGI